MGILDTITKEPEKKPLGICIPDHAKHGAKKQEIKKEISRFFVEGIYELKGEITVSGIVTSGKITSLSKLKLDDFTCSLKEISKSGSKVEELLSGEKGAITFQPDCYLRIVSGYEIELL